MERKLERYFEAFEDGELSPALCQERIQRHRDRLEVLRDQEVVLAGRLATHAHTLPDTALAQPAVYRVVVTATAKTQVARAELRLSLTRSRSQSLDQARPAAVDSAWMCGGFQVDLTGQLSNLSEPLRRLLAV